MRAVGADALHAQLPFKPSLHTVRSWATRGSIPAEWWEPVADLGVASLEELAAAAAAKAKARQA